MAHLSLEPRISTTAQPQLNFRNEWKGKILGKTIYIPVSYQQDIIHSTSFSTWQESASMWKIQLLFYTYGADKTQKGHEANYRDDDIRFEETQVLLSTQDYSLDENQA